MKTKTWLNQVTIVPFQETKKFQKIVVLFLFLLWYFMFKCFCYRDRFFLILPKLIENTLSTKFYDSQLVISKYMSDKSKHSYSLFIKDAL